MLPLHVRHDESQITQFEADPSSKNPLSQAQTLPDLVLCESAFKAQELQLVSDAPEQVAHE